MVVANKQSLVNLSKSKFAYKIGWVIMFFSIHICQLFSNGIWIYFYKIVLQCQYSTIFDLIDVGLESFEHTNKIK